MAAPQFTITSGLAAAAGALACLSYTRTQSLGALAAGAILIVIGYLVRSEEALFVLIVAVPLVRWKEVCIGRAEIVTGALVVGIVLFATLIDYQHYAGPEWAAFHALDPLRGWLTDYNFADYILEHPEQMHANGFSKNETSC